MDSFKDQISELSNQVFEKLNINTLGNMRRIRNTKFPLTLFSTTRVKFAST